MKLLITMLLAFTTAAHAEGTRGGGNEVSARIDNLLSAISEDGTNLKVIIHRYIQAIQPFDDSNLQDPSGKVVLMMAKNGLREDVDKSVYKIGTDKCYDQRTGLETSASTTITDVRKNPNFHPDVCINILKLAEEDAQPNEIAAMLFHEHARHFGFEDTDRFGRHPIARYVQKNLGLILGFPDSNLMQYLVTEKAFSEIAPGVFITATQRFAWVIAPDNAQVKIAIEKASSGCDHWRYPVANPQAWMGVEWKKFARQPELPLDSSKPIEDLDFEAGGLLASTCKLDLKIQAGDSSKDVHLEGRSGGFASAESIKVKVWRLPFNP